MTVDVRDYDSMFTILVSETIPFEVTFKQDSEVKVNIDWAEWELRNGKPLPPPSPGKLKEATSKAAECLETRGDERSIRAAAALRQYGEDYTTEKGREEQLGT